MKSQQAIMWGATFKVASAAWTVNAYAGLRLRTANLQEYTILSNTADTLYLLMLGAPLAGEKLTFGTPGWTANQFANYPGRGFSSQVSSYLVDDAGHSFAIYQNTTDSLIVTGAPSLTGGGTIVQGGTIATTLAAPSATVVGYWQIINDDGTTASDSDTKTGAVTIVASTTEWNVAQAAVSFPFALEGADSFSLITKATGSSPIGAFTLKINNKEGATIGASPTPNPGPDPLDAYWAACKVSVDGAAASATIPVTGTVNMAVPSPHPNSPILRTAWGMLVYAPTSGTGTVTAHLLAHGA